MVTALVYKGRKRSDQITPPPHHLNWLLPKLLMLLLEPCWYTFTGFQPTWKIRENLQKYSGQGQSGKVRELFFFL